MDTRDPSSEPLLAPPNEVLSTMDKDGTRRWIYPTPSKGTYYWKRLAVGWALIILYLILPIVHINGEPAILLDILHRRFAIFGAVFYATDTILLMLGMIGTLIAVVAGTALLGRVWCGWGCPQTIYMEFLYRPIERLFEGRENLRKRNDRKDMTSDLFLRKVGKYTVWFFISLGLAHVFVSYFVGWSSLLEWMTGPPSEHWGFFVMMALTTALILFDFAWFREQMCTLACPYARFQSVLMDRDSLIVSYDESRGEPRGRRKKARKKKKKQDAEPQVAKLNLEALPLGDCIDCGACVRTCPTGIDIREGLQMECIGCTQCIDACDAIMLGIHKPVGLIRYTSENALEKTNPRVLRPRVVMYGLAMAIFAVLFVVALTGRESVGINITRVPGAPYQVLPDENIANRLRFRVDNHTGEDAVFTIESIKPEGLQIRVIGDPELKVPSGELTHRDAWVVVPKEAFETRSVEGLFRITSDKGEQSPDKEFRLLGPHHK